MCAGAAREVSRIALVRRHGEDLAACGEGGANAGGRQRGFLDRCRHALEARARPRKIPIDLDVQLLRLAGLGIEEVDVTSLLVDDAVGTSRGGHDVVVVVMRELLELLRVGLIREDVPRVIAVGEEVDRVADPHRIGIVAVGPRQLLARVVGEVHDANRMRSSAAVMAPVADLGPLDDHLRPEFLIGDALAVGRIRAAEGTRHRQRFGESAVGRDAPQLEIRVVRNARAIRAEDHPLPVRAPSADAVHRGMEGEARRIAAGRGDDIDVHVAADGRRERDLRSVGREIRFRLDVGVEVSRRAAPPLRGATQRSPAYSNAMESRLSVGWRRRRVPCPDKGVVAARSEAERATSRERE